MSTLLAGLLASLLCGALPASAALSNYAFTSTTGAAADMTGATTLLGTGIDDGLAGPFNIGFTFNFDGTDYTQFWVSSNGYLSLGASAPANFLTQSLSSTNYGRPVLVPLGRDQHTGFDGGVLSVRHGSAPDQVLAVEFRVRDFDASSQEFATTFQIRLYEGSNRFEFWYGPVVTGGGAMGAEKDNSDFASINPGTDTVSYVVASPGKPPSNINRLYRFVPVLTEAIEQAVGQLDPTSTSPIQFDVKFSDPVTGFDATDVDLSLSTVGGALVAAVSGSGTTYQVQVTGMLGDGSVVASIPVGAAQDALGKLSEASTSLDNTVEFVDPDPTVTIEQAPAQVDPTSAGPVVFAVQFSEPVTGFDASDVDLSASTAGGSLHAAVSGSGASYTVEVTGMKGDGSVVAFIAASATQDAAGQGSAASTSNDNDVTFVAPLSVVEVPLFDPMGLAVLAGLLAVAGLAVLRRP